MFHFFFYKLVLLSQLVLLSFVLCSILLFQLAVSCSLFRCACSPDSSSTLFHCPRYPDVQILSTLPVLLVACDGSFSCVAGDCAVLILSPSSTRVACSNSRKVGSGHLLAPETGELTVSVGEVRRRATQQITGDAPLGITDVPCP